MLAKIISGGQTGVDRGALDAALDARFPCGGACPSGRRAEDGRIPERYPLEELASRDYLVRTERNVVISSGTLVVHCGAISAGTLATLRMAEALCKPVLVVDAATTPPDAAALVARDWIRRRSIRVLNVAGPRHSSWAGGARYSHALVSGILAEAPRA